MGGGGSSGAHACDAHWLPENESRWSEWSWKHQVRRRYRVRSGWTGWGWGSRWTSCVVNNDTVDASYWRDTDRKIDYYFDKYLDDGRMQYCELRLIDVGWDWRGWNINGWRQYYSKCKMHQLYTPKIRKQAEPYQVPKIWGGASTLDIDTRSMDSNDLGNYSGSVYKVQVPSGWTMRAYSGARFDGPSEDYPSGTKDLSNSSFVRSLQVSTARPAILSRSDNFQKKQWIAHLIDDSYSSADLNDGVFYNAENHRTFPSMYKTGIDKVWVPVGYQVTLFDGNHSGTTQVIFGHNTAGWVSTNFKVKSITVQVVMPIMFSKPNYTGFPSILVAGDNTQSTYRPVKSAITPNAGYIVTGKGKSTLEFPKRANVITAEFLILNLQVLYNGRSSYNMIDDMPVRTKVFTSERQYADKCKAECSANNDCNAYYAVRVMRECPNPNANNGEDPAKDGCRSVCGFYENQGGNIKKGAFKNMEPYLFNGQLNVKRIWEDTK